MGRPSRGTRPIDGEVVRRARDDKSMSQVEVAFQCGVRGAVFDPSMLGKIERGTVKFPARRLIPVLAEVLGLNVNDLYMQDAA